MSVNKVQLANGETIIDISDSTVTPETLAEGVTAHDSSGQKITGKMVPGGGASVQADWNQTDETAADFIKNKPVVTVGGDTLTWDTDTTGKETVGDMFVLVSSATPTLAEFANGCSMKGYHVESQTEVLLEYTSADMTESSGMVYNNNYSFIVVQEENVEMEGLVFPKKGVYFQYITGVSYFTSLTIPGYTGFAKEQIDPAFLPEPLQFGEETVEEELLAETELTADENGEAYLDYATFSNVCTEYIITCDGVTKRYTPVQIGWFDAAVGNLSILGEPSAVDTGEPFVFGISSGMIAAVFIFADTNTHTISMGGIRNIVTPIEPKFLGCDWLAQKKGVAHEILAETVITIPDTLKATATSAITSEELYNMEGFEYLRVMWNGNEQLCVAWRLINSNKYQIAAACADCVITIIDTEITIESTQQTGDVTISIELYGKFPDPIPESYLPESVESIVIRSSTANSTKKFKLTVDDSGTITATEVT